jgi:hypothetical protein
MIHSHLTARVALTADSVEACVDDSRPDTLEAFRALTEPQQVQLAHDAWHVGLRALMNAYRQAEEARLQDIGKTLLTDLDLHLGRHAQAQEKELTRTLSRYFDPESGELGARLAEFAGSEGALTHLLQKHLAPRNSVLVETLAQQVGEQSPLFRLLSPTDSQGLVAVLADRLQKVLQQEHCAFEKALDPLHADGAVGRFIARLREELKRAEDDQSKQLKIALAALDTTREDSLLNQLRRETQQARAELLRAINPASEGSPLAIIKTSLTELLSEHAKSQKELLDEARKQNAEFQRDVRDSIQRLEARRREELRTSRGGRVFEDAVAEFAQHHLGSHGYLVEPTGNAVGIRPGCKVGDLVVQFPPDHAFAGSRVVIEAKRDQSYNVTRALDELATARKNRDAQVGIFVMARSHAGPGFRTFGRYGHDVIVVWDDENPTSDPYFEAALILGMALATRTKANASEGDLQALQEVEQRLVQELNRLDKIRKSAEAIRRHAESIEKEVGVGQKKVGKIIDDARQTLTALNIALRDEAVERECPIAIDGGALVENDVALAAGGRA